MATKTGTFNSKKNDMFESCLKECEADAEAIEAK